MADNIIGNIFSSFEAVIRTGLLVCLSLSKLTKIHPTHARPSFELISLFSGCFKD